MTYAQFLFVFQNILFSNYLIYNVKKGTSFQDKINFISSAGKRRNTAKEVRLIFEVRVRPDDFYCCQLP